MSPTDVSLIDNMAAFHSTYIWAYCRPTHTKSMTFVLTDDVATYYWTKKCMQVTCNTLN